MNRRALLVAILGLAIGLLALILIWRAPSERDRGPVSPVALATSLPLFPSPLSATEITILSSPLPVPPTAIPPVNTATLEAIRATRPTATPPMPTGARLPFIAPTTWRVWSVRILAAAGVLALIGLRLRRGQ